MIPSNRHTVGRVLLDLHQAPTADRALEASLRRWQRERLPALLDQWLSAYEATDRTLRIDKIEVVLDGIDFSALETEWEKKVEPRLREAVERALAEAAPNAEPPVRSAIQVLLFFLETGRLPWQSDVAAREVVPQLVRSFLAGAEPLPAALLQMLRQQPNARVRLLQHLNDADLSVFVEKTGGPRAGSEVAKGISQLRALGQDWPIRRRLFWREVLAVLFLHLGAEQSMLEGVRVAVQKIEAGARGKDENQPQYLGEKVPSGEISKPEGSPQALGENAEKPDINSETDIKATARETDKLETLQTPLRGKAPLEAAPPADTDETSWHLPNAGIVLIAPYLPRLWAQLGWTNDQHFVSADTAWLAVQMVQFLCDGQDEIPPEYQLTLPKILCGLPPDALFDPLRPLSAEERAEGDALLQAVLANAPGLGLKTIGGLRGSFFLRAGALRAADSHWVLHVAPETHDILLDRVPWGFQVVRFSWMAAAVYVEWGR